MPEIKHIFPNLERGSIIMLMLCFICILLNPDETNAQYVTDSWNSQDGLPSSAVNDILQSDNGYLWLATFNGLVRFDGIDFKVYNTSNTSGLASNRILEIFEDSKKRMWIGTEVGQLTLLTSGKSFHIGPGNGLDTNQISDINEDTSGTIWVGTPHGIGYFNELQFHPFREWKKSSDFTLSEFYKDDEGTIWVVAQRVIYPLTSSCIENVDNCNEFAKIGPDGTISFDGTDKTHRFSEPPINHFTSLTISRDGTHWIGTNNNGIIKYKDGNIDFLSTSGGLLQNEVSEIVTDHQNWIWISTTRGLQYWRDNKFTELPEFEDHVTTSVYEDREKSIWVGTAANGLKRYKKTPIEVIGHPEGLSHDIILSVFQDRQKNIWAGTSCFGFNKIDESDGTITQYSAQSGREDRCVWALRKTRDGTLWIGDWGKGVFKMKNNSIAPAPFNDKLKSHTVVALFEDRDEALWIGTRGGGVYRWKNRQLKSYDVDDGLAHSTVTYIFQSSDGSFWFGTYNGISHYKDGRFYNITRADGLSHSKVRALFEPQKGIIWAGTYGGGLNQITTFGNDSVEVKALTENQGLYDNIISSIREDDLGRIWMGGNKGISRLPKTTLTDYFSGVKKTVKPVSYGVPEGMRNRETNGGFQPSSWKTEDGRLLFPTVKRLVVLHPDRIHKNNVPPPVIIERITVNDSLEYVVEDTSVVLAPGQNEFSIKFTANSFQNPRKVQFSYRLHHFDDNWKQTTNRREAYYTNVPPGEYRFQVRAANNDGVWNSEGAYLALTVQPYFFQTNWFYAVVLGSLLLLIYGGMHWRFRAINQRKQALKEAVKEQTAIVRRQNKKLQEMNRIKSRFFANISHEFRTPLSLILGFIDEIKKNPSKNDMQKELSLMGKNAERLHILVDQLLDLAALDSNSMPLEVSEGSVDALLKLWIHSFQSRANQKNIDLKFKPQPGLPIKGYIDGDKLEKIITNLLSNALKFTPENGTVLVKLQTVENGKHFKISVIDTGPGIPDEMLPKVFNRFYQAKQSMGSGSNGMGIGLALTKELVELHGGSITVDNNSGNGTTFTVEMPLDVRDRKNATIAENGYDEKLLLSESDNDYTTPKDHAENRRSRQQTECPLVLIVDDNPDFRYYLKSILNSYRVIEAHNGKNALKKAEKHVPDLIISDIMMPEMDGYDFCRTVQENEKISQVPMIFLTAKSGEEAKMEGLRTGAVDYLEKPFKAEELLKRINNQITLQKRLQKKLRTWIRNGAQKEDAATGNDSESMERVFLKRLIGVLEKHLDDDSLTVETLSKEVGISRTQLHRKLKAITGQSASQFIHSYKLNKSKTLLERKSGTITEIAYQLGYSSSSYFSRCFKEKFGCSPSSYQKKITRNN